MRHTFKTIAAILTVFISATLFAKADSATSAYFKVLAQKNDYSYKVIYKGLEQGNVNVQWTNEKGQIVYKEVVKGTEGFVKQYDLSILPDGEYTVSLSSVNIELSETVRTGDLSDFNFVVQGQGEKNVLLAGFQPQGKDVTVVILNDAKDVIYTSSLVDTKAVQKKFNFDKIETESVTFVLYHNDKLFKEESIAF